MDFELQWLLIALPAVFALGWAASRFDLRQLRRDGRQAPKAYFRGLNLLLNEQHDKAIDAFIEAVQHDPDTTELHFGLGNLFRRRGDFERAVRVHQHLLERADLKAVDRHRAQHALADDFMKAGLFDRAEAAYKAAEGTAFDTEARSALLSLHERARDWRAATEVATELERRGSGSFATRIAHYACELALQADAAGQPQQAEQELQRARAIAPRALRPMLLAGQRLARAGDHDAALQQWDTLLAQQPQAWPLVAADYARSARACTDCSAACERLQAAYAAEPDIDLLQARIELEGTPGQHERLVLDHLQRQPTLSAAAKVLELPLVQWDESTPQQLRQVVATAARPLQRYRCAACGFEAHHYFWQCPGCQGWDTYPPHRMESL
ncbi:MAG TPA: lipopolysaccharide assembly protein LapB [Rubrivivax sp.]|nr:lipopolysaccharide assembly protein LapB [Rubrivivax sp.]